jgi:micrococcal nuclease
MRYWRGPLTLAGMLSLVVSFIGLPSSADPLAPPEAAVLATRLLDSKVWLVHAVVVRVIDGDTVVVNMDLGWHTWRHDEHVRLNGIDAPERTDPVRWAEAKTFVERLLPVGTEVLLVSEKLEKYGRTLGRILLRDGRDVSQEVLKAGLAMPTRAGHGPHDPADLARRPGPTRPHARLLVLWP